MSMDPTRPEPDDRPVFPEEPSFFLDERPPAPPRPLLAWCVILVVTAGVVAFQMWRPEPAAAKKEEAKARDPQEGLQELLARGLVGFTAMPEQTPQEREEARKQAYEQARQLFDQGSFRQRLKFVILARDFAGPEKALEHLKELEQSKLERTEEDKQLAGLLEKLYQSHKGKDAPDASALTAE